VDTTGSLPGGKATGSWGGSNISVQCRHY